MRPSITLMSGVAGAVCLGLVVSASVPTRMTGAETNWRDRFGWRDESAASVIADADVPAYVASAMPSWLFGNDHAQGAAYADEEAAAFQAASIPFDPMPYGDSAYAEPAYTEPEPDLPADGAPVEDGVDLAASSAAQTAQDVHAAEAAEPQPAPAPVVEAPPPATLASAAR